MKQAFIPLVERLTSLKNRQDVTEQQTMIIVKPYVQWLVDNPSWLEDKYYQVDEASGFNGYKIYECPDHSMAVFVTSWLAGRGAPPHNHDTWAISASVVGEEHHLFWEREELVSGQYKMRVIDEQTCKQGDVFCLDSSVIHSVENPLKTTSITLQVYGKHPNYTQRHQFDVSTGEASGFQGKEADEN